MTSEELVKKIRSSVLDENQAISKDIFQSTNINDASDLYWQQALGLYEKLDDAEREIFFRIVHQTTVDTISNMFGVLDGVSTLEGFDGGFVLTLENEEEQLNGELQDIFLEIEEDS